MYTIVRDFNDFAALTAIESRAAQMFREVGYDPSNWSVATSSDYQNYAEKGQLWVCTYREGVAVGFAVVERVGEIQHLVEIDTDPEFMGQGVATALLNAVIACATASGVVAITLRTFKTTPWSTNLYQKFGFAVLGEPLPAYIDRYRKVEEVMGLPLGDLITMQLILNRSGF